MPAGGSSVDAMPATQTLIGVDVGGSGIKAALVDIGTGSATGRIRHVTPQPATPDAVAETVANLVNELGIEGPIGCTLPAVVVGGTVRTAAHIDDAWIGTHAAAVIGRATGRRCAVLNDADAAGIAEARFGAARDRRGVAIMVTVGTGVGTALLNDGVLVANSELGHLEVNGKIADVWASDARRVEKQLTWPQWAERLNTYLTKLHSVLWPELIVIGGGVAKKADLFLDLLDPGCEVRVAELGNLAGMVGAALMASTSEV
jgi:polyphosphate glucokinase